MLSAWATLVAADCGGTTGQENLPSPTAPSGDATVEEGGREAGRGLDAGAGDDAAFFDVEIAYADAGRLPDVSPPPEGGGLEAGSGLPTCSLAAGDICSGNDSGVCTPTECLFLRHSKDCYNCLLAQGCLNDDTYNDTGNECHDVVGNVPFNFGSVAREDVCLNTILCTLQNHSAGDGIDGGPSNTPVLNFGYCGVQPTTTSCTEPSGQNGPCLMIEETGTETLQSNVVLSRYTAKQFGGGMGNSLFACAIANLASPGCSTCLQ